ncbi:hypothetical protein A9973_17470 [Achromobacter sp. UMC46]|nr:hypothetical protein [Achromobacter sp. UMC46]
MTFFFEASTRDSQYWNSVSSFTEDATGDWGLQALKALGALNLAGLAAGVILLIGYPGHARPIGALAASGSFLLGLLLAFPALKLTGKSREFAKTTASLHSREAGVASTWEQLRLANTADPNAGRRERKIAVQMAWIMIASLIIGCIALISTAWL